MDSEATRLFVWNWLPARYAAPCRWRALGDIPRSSRGSRAERVLSAWLIERYGLTQYLEAKLPFAWLAEPVECLERRAFETGVASCASAIARTLGRKEILHLRAILGDAAYEQALNGPAVYPLLSGRAADWTPAAASVPDFIRRGAGLLCGLLGSGGGAAERLQLRFDFDADAVPHLNSGCTDELIILQQRWTAEPDAAFDWALPEIEAGVQGNAVEKENGS